MAGKTGRRGFGHVRKLPSGRWQASYLSPDGQRHTARSPEGKPLTFTAKQDAEGWLSLRHSEILRGAWLPEPKSLTEAPSGSQLLRAYGEAWLAGRDLSESTRRLYAITLRNQIYPALGDIAVTEIAPAAVRAWHAGLRHPRDASKPLGPTQRAHAYSLLRTILNTAVADDVIPANPCRVRGAGQSKRARTPRPASVAELEAIAAAMPARYRLMVLLAAWCALRFGELAELRRSDIEVKNGVVHIRRGVIRAGTGEVVKTPKSEAGKRDVNIPPHLMAAVRAHLRDHVAARADALVFPAAAGGHMAPSSLYAVFHPARDKAGRPDLRFHDLRHTGAVLAAATGATLAELMARLGHSTVSAAMRYQHAAADRDKAIAAALSGLATVTPITAAKGKRKTAVS
jgi:integrase